MSDRRTTRHKVTKAEILAAAWWLADRDGIAGLSLREVAAKVGMRPPSLYTYFESKDALYDAMFSDANRQMMDAMARLAERQPADGDPATALAHGIDGWIRFCQESIARYQILFTRAIPGWAPSEAAYADAIEAYGMAAEFVARYGITRQEDLDLYTAVTAGLAAQQMANDPKGDRWRRTTPRVVRMLLTEIEGRS
jgi:AcrR family transcriptional regulator